MRDTLSLLALLAGAFTAVNPVFGSFQDESEEEPSCSDLIVKIASDADIDFYSECSEVISLFHVAHDFTGPFEMPNLETVGQFSSGYLGPKLKGSDRVDDGVTSISMPDLEVVEDSMLMAYLNDLTSISFPKLHTISIDLVILDNPKVKKLTLPALKNVTQGVLIEGDFDEIHLPKLTDVGFLQVKSTGDLDCRALGKDLSSLVFHPQEFDVGEGFTCWTSDEENRYDSSEHTSSKGNGSDDSDDSDDSEDSKDSDGSDDSEDPTATGEKPAESSSPGQSEGTSVRVGCLPALISLVAMVTFQEFLM